MSFTSRTEKKNHFITIILFFVIRPLQASQKVGNRLPWTSDPTRTVDTSD